MRLRSVRTLDAMPAWLTVPLSAISAGAFPLMLLLLVAIVVPVAAIAFSRSGRGLDELGRGRFAVDFEDAGSEDREEELRQLVEARAWRRRRRGEDPGDVEAEIARILALDPEGDPVATSPDAEAGHAAGSPPSGDGASVGPTELDPVLREEIRQVVVARNESLRRRGMPPLDIDAEIDRLASELT